jgi:hypothetical protein
MLEGREIPFVRCGRVAFVKRKTPLPFKFTNLSQSSNVCSSSGRLIAIEALLTKMSIFPYSSFALSARKQGPVVVEMSASTALSQGPIS